MIKFVLMVNKQGQTRLAHYYDFQTIEQRVALEAEIIRKCLSRNENQCSFVEYRGLKVVYRRYASLFFIVGCDPDEEVRAAAPGRALVVACATDTFPTRLPAANDPCRAAERARYIRIHPRARRDHG